MLCACVWLLTPSFVVQLDDVTSVTCHRDHKTFTEWTASLEGNDDADAISNINVNEKRQQCHNETVKQLTQWAAVVVVPVVASTSQHGTTALTDSVLT